MICDGIDDARVIDWTGLFGDSSLVQNRCANVKGLYFMVQKALPLLNDGAAVSSMARINDLLCLGSHQNSILPWNAIMRGEVSPPRPTPSRPVGGDVVLCSVPNLAMGEPGTPAWTVLGSAKFG